MRKLNQIVHNYAIFFILKYHFCRFICCLSQIFIIFVISNLFSGKDCYCTIN